MIYQDLSQEITKLRAIFKKTEIRKSKEVFEIGLSLYDSLILQYEFYGSQPKKVELQVYLCNKVVNETIIPKLQQTIRICENATISNLLYGLWLKFFALSARRSFSNFLLYYGHANDDNLWKSALPTLKHAIHFMEQMFWYQKIEFIVLSMPPSCGKSYLLNNYSAWRFGQDINDSTLRVSFSDENVVDSSINVREIIKSNAYADIFPHMSNIRFAKEKEGAWKFEEATKTPANFYAKSRDGQITGKRANLNALDDVIKGLTEATNVALNEFVFRKLMAEAETRVKAGQKLQTILAGTPWSTFDPIAKYRSHYTWQETQYLFTSISECETAISIAIPAIDENGVNMVSYAYTDAKLARFKKMLYPHEWQAMFQQDPLPLEGLDFAYENLRIYDMLPTVQDGAVYASLDPPRTGANYCSMPIVKKVDEHWYLIDCVFRRKPLTDLYDLIVEKIVFHRIQKLIIEKNTDTSLRQLLVDRLKIRGYNGCIITEKYAVKNKAVRISDEQGNVRDKIVFPAKGLHNENSDIGVFMKQFTNYSFDHANKFDDAPDSLCLLVNEFLGVKQRNNKPQIVPNILRW